MNSADQKAEQENAGDGQRRDIDRPVLPQFTSYRPEHWPARRQARVRAAVRGEGVRHGGLLSIHLAAPCAWTACFPITATNMGAIRGGPTPPTPATCGR